MLTGGGCFGPWTSFVFSTFILLANGQPLQQPQDPLPNQLGPLLAPPNVDYSQINQLDINTYNASAPKEDSDDRLAIIKGLFPSIADTPDEKNSPILNSDESGPSQELTLPKSLDQTVEEEFVAHIHKDPIDQTNKGSTTNEFFQDNSDSKTKELFPTDESEIASKDKNIHIHKDPIDQTNEGSTTKEVFQDNTISKTKELFPTDENVIPSKTKELFPKDKFMESKTTIVVPNDSKTPKEVPSDLSTKELFPTDKNSESKTKELFPKDKFMESKNTIEVPNDSKTPKEVPSDLSTKELFPKDKNIESKTKELFPNEQILESKTKDNAKDDGSVKDGRSDFDIYFANSKESKELKSQRFENKALNISWNEVSESEANMMDFNINSTEEGPVEDSIP